MLCECGCGETTNLAKETNRRYGHVKGQALRFINGHNRRVRRDWILQDCGYETPCWIWQGTINTEGYGVLRIKYVQIKAHRWVRKLLGLPVPDDLAVDHLCEVKACVNPEHVEACTGAENSRRHWARRRAERVAVAA